MILIELPSFEIVGWSWQRISLRSSWRWFIFNTILLVWWNSIL